MEIEERIGYSVIIPVFNEEESLGELYKRLVVIMEKLEGNYEMIFVDDGSKDKSFEILKALHFRDKKVKIIKFTRNFGHHSAISAGLDYAKGNIIILMDGDLQDPPEEIPNLDKKLKEGFDIVYAIRETRDDSFFKKLNSKIFYTVFRLISNIEIPANTGIFLIMNRQVLDYLKKMNEKSRFLTGIISWGGFTHTGVMTKRNNRCYGKSKYNLLKEIRLAITAIVSFSNFPLHIATYTGFLIAAVSFLIGLYMLVRKVFFGMAVLGYASVVVSLFFLGGIQLIILGIIGEYIGKAYAEIRNRPLYIVKEYIKD